MAPPQSAEDPAERELFDTLRSTYHLAGEPELRAMIQELRFHLPTIPAGERAAMIDRVENVIGRTMEDDLEFDL